MALVQMPSLFSEAWIVSNDPEAPGNFRQAAIQRPEQLAEHVNLRRTQNAFHCVTLRDHECELEAEYRGASDVDISVCTKTPASGPSCEFGLFAEATYDAAGDRFVVKKVSFAFSADAEVAHLGPEVLPDQIARALAMFRHVRAIAPIVFSEKLKTPINILGRGPADKKAAVRQQLKRLAAELATRL